MLAADRSLLEVNLRQQAIKLREKVGFISKVFILYIKSYEIIILIYQELNLYSENFSAMATQAAVLAGFTTTCIIEITIPDTANAYIKGLLHICGIISICSNIACVSLSTITTIWGSGKALRGTDGSMDEAVEGINNERGLIFSAFAIGLAGNLFTILCACFIIMDFPISLVCAGILIYTCWLIYSNAKRIQAKFAMTESEAVRLDDLTSYNMKRSGSQNTISSSASLLGRGKKPAIERV